MKTSNVRVLPASPHDAISIELIRELSAELGAMYGNDGSGAFRPEDVAVPRAAFVIAWLDDEPAGCGALRPINDYPGIGEIKRMYVRPAFRGSGISKQILTTLETLAREYAYQTLWLETGTKQGAAIALYDNSGFTRMSCYGHYGDDPESVCFEKSL